ncbi:MAG: acyl-CoA dehydrogenase [Herpetosiphon sp.]
MDLNLTSEQLRIQELVRTFAQHEIAPRAKEIDETGAFPHDIFRRMAALGLMGLPVPVEYGGMGADTISLVLAVEEIGKVCGSTALTYLAHIGLGSMPLLYYGTEEQKQRYLVPAARGEYLAAFGLTEPQSGSDAGAILTSARLEGDEWVLNGEKMWITNAAFAGHVIIAAITDPDKGKRGISSIIIPRGTAGMSFGPHEQKMGLRGSYNTAVYLRDVRVPKENLLGERGRGYATFLRALDGGRITVAAQANGHAQAAMDAAVDYARTRQSMGKPIGGYQSISNMIADMEVELEAARLLTMKAAYLKDQGQPFSKAAAIAKLFASEASERICRNAIQVLGGWGYSKEYPVERYYRDTRLLTIGEGTSEIQRIVIGRHVLGDFAGSS